VRFAANTVAPDLLTQRHFPLCGISALVQRYLVAWRLLQASARRKHRNSTNHAPATKMNKGPLYGALFHFCYRGRVGFREAGQQNALAFWTHAVRPAGVRIDPREIRINPAPATRKPSRSHSWGRFFRLSDVEIPS